MSAKVFRNDLNPRVAVTGIMGVGNALYKWYSPEGPMSFHQITDMYIDLFLKGLRNQKVKKQQRKKN
jgi:hypothetical protein